MYIVCTTYKCIGTVYLVHVLLCTSTLYYLVHTVRRWTTKGLEDGLVAHTRTQCESANLSFSP